MAGQVVQAIIVPQGASLDILKDVFGDEWDNIRTDMVERGDGEHSGTIVYVQKERAAFKSVRDPVVVKGRDGKDTGVSIVTGELIEDAEKSSLLDTTVTKEFSYEVFQGERLWDACWQFGQVVASAFALEGITDKQRRQIIGAAFDSLRTVIDGILTETGGKAVSMKRASGGDRERGPSPYGLADFMTRMISEVRKAEGKVSLGTRDTDPENNFKTNMNTNDGAGEGINDVSTANTGGGDMADQNQSQVTQNEVNMDNYVTKAALDERLTAFKSEITGEVDSVVKSATEKLGGEVTEALKGVKDTLGAIVGKPQGDGQANTQDTTQVVANSDQNTNDGKQANVSGGTGNDTGSGTGADVAHPVQATGMAGLVEEIRALKTVVDDQAKMIDALQHQGNGFHRVTESGHRGGVKGSGKAGKSAFAVHVEEMAMQ